jgi:hypothetical protein
MHPRTLLVGQRIPGCPDLLEDDRALGVVSHSLHAGAGQEQMRAGSDEAILGKAHHHAERVLQPIPP